jgi:hypothetical protein
MAQNYIFLLVFQPTGKNVINSITTVLIARETSSIEKA